MCGTPIFMLLQNIKIVKQFFSAFQTKLAHYILIIVAISTKVFHIFEINY